MTTDHTPFREPTDDEMATLNMPDDLCDDDELTALDRLEALDLRWTATRSPRCSLDADADNKEERTR